MIKPRPKAGQLTGTLLGLAFAAVVTLLYALELKLPQLAAPAVGQRSPVTLRLPTLSLSTMQRPGALLTQQRIVVVRGGILTQEGKDRLDAVEGHRREHPFGPLVGYGLAV